MGLFMINSGPDNIFAEALQGLFGNKNFSLQMLEKFPYPIWVFSADGALEYVNPIFLELYGIEDAAQIVGKYNLLSDPLCFAQPWTGYRELFRKAFKGEIVKCYIPSPIEPPVDIKSLEKGIIPEPDVTELCFHPVRNGEELVFVVSVFIVNNLKMKKGDNENGRSKKRRY